MNPKTREEIMRCQVLVKGTGGLGREKEFDGTKIFTWPKGSMIVAGAVM